MEAKIEWCSTSLYYHLKMKKHGSEKVEEKCFLNIKKKLDFLMTDLIATVAPNCKLIILMRSFCAVHRSLTRCANLSCIVFAGLWLGICRQLAWHMGAVLCLLDLPLSWSNIGCLGLPGFLSPTTTSEKTEESLKGHKYLICSCT